MVNMLISENASSISMLKVLGYENRQINRMVINVYHFLVPVGLVIGSVLGVVLCKANFEASVSAYNTYIETVYGSLGFVKYAVWVIVSYVISLWLLGRKVRSMDMVESLKDNRE
ncbi:ABC transporter permease [Roseburia sp. MSJ-14]|nr:ABC transporter permease [Roseburia sp. MSJ-14]